MSLSEYHARQMANQAGNRASASQAEDIRLQQTIRNIRAHLDKALELLGEDTNPEAKAELQRAVQKLNTIRQ